MSPSIDLLFTMYSIPFDTIPLEGDGFHIIINVELLEKQFKMVIDTGASKTVLDQQTLLESGIPDDQLISSNVLSTGLGTNEMKSHLLQLTNFKIGDWQINSFNVAVLDLATINFAYQQMNIDPVVGVLGGDILHPYGAIIDYKKKILKLNQKKVKGRSS